ncbi:hypothetical protein C2L80_07060 [Rubneribacter badeniensis]|uniref:Uncharacterized protein n=1 Tax=Rubneribacter badeniensis TaxID=2070688 RepID=A0A2K2U4V3_9ACTN|nr:hypothetical protein C2L80_07060 [Rubneribacter badeniensis]
MGRKAALDSEANGGRAVMRGASPSANGAVVRIWRMRQRDADGGQRLKLENDGAAPTQSGCRRGVRKREDRGAAIRGERRGAVARLMSAAVFST